MLSCSRLRRRPAVFWDLSGKSGHPIRTTVNEMGPALLGRILELNDVQVGTLEVAFKLADERGLLLLDSRMTCVRCSGSWPRCRGCLGTLRLGEREQYEN